MERIWKFLSSLKLTVVLLAFGVVLVFVGTVAQADEGLYNAQERYFKHWFVPYFSFFGTKVPVPLPGGYFLGTALLVNLLAAHYTRFKWGWKKSGIFLTHLGIIMLLVGQLATDLLSRETQMHFAEGQTRYHSESSMDYELAIISDANPETEDVVAIPASLLKSGGEIKNDKLPFTLKVKEFWRNSEPSFRAPMKQNAAPLTTNGVAQSFDFARSPDTKTMEEKNVPTAIIEVVDSKQSYGAWVFSGWSGDEAMVNGIRRSFARQMDEQLANKLATQLAAEQAVEVGGKRYAISLRPARFYNQYAMTLLQTTHTVYRGTDTPKDFRSRVRIDNKQTGESREVDIYMNNPLRYQGLTFYQFQMGKDDLDRNRGTSVLQVVRNPGWLTPYFGCILVGLGLVVQFMIHLVGFISKRRTA
jgi:hypothetical protein